MNTKYYFGLIVLMAFTALIFGFAGAIAGINYYQSRNQVTDNDRIKSLYDEEMAAKMSPATLKGMIDKKDDNYILVDLRSKEEYLAEHIVGAVSIPAVSLSEEQLLAEFKKLPTNKEIIVHCYSAYCALGRQVGQFLANNSIFVKELSIGWSEWKYYWGLWNPGEDPKVGKSYVVKENTNVISPPNCTQGKFGC